MQGFFFSPAIQASWDSLQEAIDYLYYLSRETDRPWYPGFVRPALEGLLAHQNERYEIHIHRVGDGHVCTCGSNRVVLDMSLHRRVR